jgi:hypothetical protein
VGQFYHLRRGEAGNGMTPHKKITFTMGFQPAEDIVAAD